MEDRNPETGENHLQLFVGELDGAYKKKLKKIKKERMFMLDRQMVVNKLDQREEKFCIAGSTGNTYTTVIGRKPNCNCMDVVSSLLYNYCEFTSLTTG